MPERQIISDRGVSVEITHNLESKKFPHVISLCVGGVDTFGGVKKRFEQRQLELQDEEGKIFEEIHPAIIAQLKNEFPEVDESFRYLFGFSKEDPEFFINSRYANIRHNYLESHSEIKDRLKQIEEEQRIPVHLEEKYEFSPGSRSALDDGSRNDVKFGKEGTLAYSLVKGKIVADEITFYFGELQKQRGYLVQYPGYSSQDINWQEIENAPQDLSFYNDLLQELSKSQVADIHQISVLPSFRGKGLAKALFDVAKWDIEDTKRVRFSIARISQENLLKVQVLELFEKAGFTQKIYCPPIASAFGSGHSGGYYLVIKDNQSRS